MSEEALRIQRMFGQALVEQGLVNEDQLGQLLADQATKKLRVGEAAVSAGFMAEEELAKCVAEFFQFPYTTLKNEDEIDLSAVELIPELMARRYAILVVKKEEGLLTLVMADPLDVRAVDAVRVETGCRVTKMVASREAILAAIDRSYHASSRIAKSISTMSSITISTTGCRATGPKPSNRCTPRFTPTSIPSPTSSAIESSRDTTLIVGIIRK